MLNAASDTAHLPPASLLVYGSWTHLSIPQRMARVIERKRHLITEVVTRDDFAGEPETCDLDSDELLANIGRAKQLIEGRTPEPTYNRAERVRQGTEAIFAVMPDRERVIDTLALHNFSRLEADALAGDIVAAAAERWKAAGAVLTAPLGDMLSERDRRNLARNAE